MILLFVLLFTHHASATWDASLFERRQAALTHFGVDEEPDFQDLLRPWSGRQSRIQFEAVLSVLDPANTLSRYATWDDRHLMVFQDVDARTVPDFTVTFAPADAVPHETSHTAYVADSAPESSPLAGLRVALDPGHFGNEIDNHVGKIAHAGRTVLREGTITGQTVWLVKKRLMDLGVRSEDILITRPRQEPVTTVSYDDFPLNDFARHELLHSADEYWFLRLLARATSIEDLYRDFDASHEITSLFVSRDHSTRWASQRTHLFALVAELEARAAMLNSFNPDLTVIIHYDTASTGHGLQRAANHVKAFVPGHWQSDELGTREERYSLVQHALNTPGWLRSVSLSRHIVQGVSNSTGVPIHRGRGATIGASERGRAVAAGVFTRNLVLNRLHTETGAITYLESLFYNNADEFQRLTRETETTTVEGYTFTHSARVDEVARGVVEGILEYVRSTPAQEAGM